ncbi:MAG TPA: ABC transporter permease [Vicinamibacterales bacterium]|nr:ABC transporter permease [Vicinamibacterales bacterium]
MPELTVAPARRSHAWQAFLTAAWLGWQIESNWADPWVFAIYTLLKPLALAGILSVMYAAVARGGFASPAFAYLFVGNAFYQYVSAVMTGMGWAVVEDRERYRMLKSVYTAPIDLRAYLLGRGAARFVTACVSVSVTLALGVWALHLPLEPGHIEWPLLGAALVLGIVVLGSMGLIVAGLMLVSGDQAWGLGELTAGALYVSSGAIFPLTVMPSALRACGEAIPLTYWLELIRRALVPGAGHAFPRLATWSDAHLAVVMTGITGVWAAAALVVFHACGTTARRRGLIDRTSNY